MLRRVVCVLLLAWALIPVPAWAAWDNCGTLDLTAWTAEQRRYLHHVLAVALANLSTRHTFVGNGLRLCAETALPTLDSAILQTAAQAAVDAYVTGNAARQAELDEARTEVASNTLCNASLAALVTRINAEQAAIQADIDASTNLAQAKVALTTINTRYGAALKFLARCDKSRTLLQRERQ